MLCSVGIEVAACRPVRTVGTLPNGFYELPSCPWAGPILLHRPTVFWGTLCSPGGLKSYARGPVPCERDKFRAHVPERVCMGKGGLARKEPVPCSARWPTILDIPRRQRNCGVDCHAAFGGGNRRCRQEVRLEGERGVGPRRKNYIL